MRFAAVVVIEGVVLGSGILLFYWMICLHLPKAVTNGGHTEVVLM